MTDPWQQMDDWCKRQCDRLAEQAEAMVNSNAPLASPEFRRVLGQSQAFGRMRSFIHGARKAERQ